MGLIGHVVVAMTTTDPSKINQMTSVIPGLSRVTLNDLCVTEMSSSTVFQAVEVRSSTSRYWTLKVDINVVDPPAGD